MNRIVIACYRPKPGSAEKLIELTRSHHGWLLAEGLVTERKPIIMQAEDETVIEIFEWRSKEAIEHAHRNPAVQQMWQEFGEISEYVSVAEIAEARQLFSDFAPIQSDIPVPGK